VDNVKGWDIDTFTYELAYEWDLGTYDMILVLDIGGQNYYLAPSSSLQGYMTNNTISSYLNKYLEPYFASGNYDGGVLALYDALSGWYETHDPSAHSGSSYQQYDNYGSTSGFSQYATLGIAGTVISVIFFIIILLLILSIIDNARYYSYRRRYVGVPPIAFYPILFWHGPGWGWYTRRHHMPDAHFRDRPGPRPPGGGHGSPPRWPTGGCRWRPGGPSCCT
jgi:uncharacterized membrane protein YgcG